VATDPRLEHEVLRYLRSASQSRAGLVQRTGETDLQVQALLDELMAGKFVVRRPRAAGALYELTKYGAGRLHLLDQLTAAKTRAARGRVKRRLPVPRPPQQPAASEADRLDCYYTLFTLHEEGRLTKRQLRHNHLLVQLARTRADLDAVFAPLLATPPPRRRMSVWQWIGWRILGGPRPQ
jgi:hypothetical protein